MSAEIVNAVRQITPKAPDVEFEGDRQGWHIRLAQRVPLRASEIAAYAQSGVTITALETWQLWNGDICESSPTIKEYAKEWMLEEQRPR